ncbi:two-component regulator propeller domain-containing protein [Pontibacter roseus]|uniref:two-component regulator propeller domain-containing protein n=1 Tax=Pontibacter roseus TaxID=336989 RepID=UPI00036E7E5C|nr:two-component regulator propeller domain-containing protein [Pontibacter roseus]
MRLFTLLFILLCALQLQAQQYNFRNWSLEQGLPQSQVNDMLQDHQGQLWVATLGGIGRLDGTGFSAYTKREGLSSNSIRCLLQDSKRHIWVGTYDNGLMRYDGDTFQAYATAAGLPPGGVYDIAEDTQGRLWVATGSGIFYARNGRFHLLDSLPQIAYAAILATPTNELWAASAAQGLYRVATDGITHYTSANSALPDDAVNVLSQSPAGTVWIGTQQGVATFRQNILRLFKLPPAITKPDVTAFTTDTYGHQWISFRNQGVLKYAGKKFEHLTRLSGLRTDRVNTLATDTEGNIWVGTTGYGLMQYRNPWFVHYFDMGNVKEPTLSALAQDTQGRVWLGTDDGLAAYMEAGTINWLQTDVWPQGTTLHSMWVRNKDEVWVCTSRGVYQLTPSAAKHYGAEDDLPSLEVYQALPDNEDNLLFATERGLALLPKGGKTIRPVSGQPATGQVYALHRDAHNTVWLGAENGVFRYEGGKVIEDAQLQQVGFREVMTIAEDQQGTLYFGGFNHGIVAMHRNWQMPKVYTSRNGLPNEGIKSLYVDRSNHLWVGTSSSVLKIRLDELHQQGRLSFRSYANQDGFRGIEVSRNGITQTPDGTVWFATAKGLTKYLPDLDRQNKVYPTAMLSHIMLNLNPTDWERLGYKTDSVSGLPLNLRLPHNQNHLTFDFQGICLSAPDRVKYKYRLKGHDDNWSSVTDQSIATYASLDPGEYTFQLLAANNDGYWTPNPVTYSFSIVPPIWRREWFIILLLLLGAAGTISVVRLREKSLVKLNTLLEMKVRHRTQLLEEKHREKEILLKEIHHRVKNNLQIVMSMLNLQARHVKDPQALEVMQAIRSRVRSMALLHERLYQHDDLATIDLQDYFRGICESLYATYGMSREQVRLDLDIPPIMVDIDSAISLGLIVNELVSNSLKYAFPDKTGELRIRLQEQGDDNYTLTVSDNGIGLPHDFEERQKKSFGLQLVSSLSRKLNGNVQFKNKNGTYSILHFVLES